MKHSIKILSLAVVSISLFLTACGGGGSDYDKLAKEVCDCIPDKAKELLTELAELQKEDEPDMAKVMELMGKMQEAGADKIETCMKDIEEKSKALEEKDGKEKAEELMKEAMKKNCKSLAALMELQEG